MPYIIDGHNLIPHIPGLALDNPDDENLLIAYLQKFARAKRTQVELYFDRGTGQQSAITSYTNLKVVFARQPTIADELIRKRLLKLKGDAKNWHVVTSDRQVIAEARAAGAKPIASPKFSSLLMKTLDEDQDLSAEGGDSLDAAEIDEWLKLFNSKPSRSS